MPETPISIVGGGYGVISTPYLRLTDKLGDKANQVTTLRVGDIVKITQVRTLFDPSRKIWIDYYFLLTDEDLSGWSSSEFVEQFKYKNTAQNYKKILDLKRSTFVKSYDEL
ncbi:MAG: hypothetical protein ACRCVN_00630 [Spirochaetia bacterium]